MFEARLIQGSVLKKMIDAIKDIVTDINLDCSSTGISVQAMDSGHVCLVLIELGSDGFEPYRCDRNITLGLGLKALSVVVRCANNDDSITIKAQEGTDNINFVFESPNGEKTSQFEIKLMDIDSEHLGIPDTEYDSVVKMPSHEFQRICRDMSQLGDSIVVACTKDGIQFSASGDMGSGKINLRQSSLVDKEEDQINIELNDPVHLTFALRYLNYFTKATPLSPTVTLSLKAESPLCVTYPIGDFGSMKFFLAPKIDDEDTAAATQE
ncbi:PREDICTED: proliferating cell nuclear antigen-like [Amphimedon queenslandica]|uniref:DNA sliding clamp PCNA n=1 Tax=Amphimedon queenslandica TaxID=400682 RepID=A0A1X7VKX8_AMPQE|nr:PREDICTED: proliferating cell nuclear antigen-like [Amphimedon queenslandica]|eukprot:XP_019863932.1 PREDICTED: proliferating cell nuclear antigen-like [Amphimedon queenslandica]